MTCKHDLIQTFRLETGEPVMWACAECMAKFVPMRQLMDEVVAEREECAKVVEAEQARVLGKQEGESWDAVNINIRMTAVLLPDIAAAIRSRT